jgi:hypothetical protein
MWSVATTEELDRWFASLNADEQLVIDSVVRLLTAFGSQLGRPHADTLKGSRHANMKELRAGTSTSVLRVAFAFDPNRSAILLVGGNKAGVNERRFYKRLIKAADDLFDAHLLAIRRSNQTDKR